MLNFEGILFNMTAGKPRFVEEIEIPVDLATTLEQKASNADASGSATEAQDITPIDVVLALYDYVSSKSSQESQYLNLKQGDMIYVLSKLNSGWWDGIIIDDLKGKVTRGWFPHNYTCPIKDNPMSLAAHLSSERKPSFCSVGSSSRRSSGQSSIKSRKMYGVKSRRGSRALSPTPSFSNEKGGINPLTNIISHKSLLPVGPNGLIYSNSMSSAVLSSLDPNGDSSESVFQKNVSSSKLNPSSDPNDTSMHLNYSGIQNNSSSGSNNKISGKRNSQPGADNPIKILSLDEVEMIVSSVHTNNSPTWTPLPAIDVEGSVDSTDKVIYYNKELDLYCSEFPLLSNSVMESDLGSISNTQFPNEDHTVSLATRKISYINPTESVSPNTALFKRPCNTIEEKLQADTISLDTSLNFSHTSPSHKPSTPSTNISNKLLPKHSAPMRLQKKPILSKDDLFYYNSNDIRNWEELQECTLQYIKDSHNMFKERNFYIFTKSFDLAVTFVGYFQLASKLIQRQINNAGEKKDIRKTFKSILSSLAEISINSRIYFDSLAIIIPNHCNSDEESYENCLDIQRSEITVGSNACSEMTSQEERSTPARYSNAKSGTRNVSTSTTDTITLKNIRNEAGLLEHENTNRSPGTIGTWHTNQTRSRDQVTESLNFEKEESAHNYSQLANSIFDVTDQEFMNLIKKLNILYTLFQPFISASDFLLPQLLPRFFKGSFSGGSWLNPFAPYIHNITTSGINLSSASLRGFSSHSSLVPPKMADAIVLASGQPINEKAAINKNISLTSTMALNSSNRSLYQRTFNRAKSTKRKSSYPLHTDTLELMKIRAMDINDKISILKAKNFGISNNSKTETRNLEINSATYEQIKQSNQLLEILENLDLTVFVNLRRLLKLPPPDFDAESQEFLTHAIHATAPLLTEFFDIKQMFHDTIMCLIMTTQQTTLDDPCLFASMRTNVASGFYEPRKRLNSKFAHSTAKSEQNENYASELYQHLVSQDVEFNGMEFLSDADDLKIVCDKYLEISKMVCNIVGQLIEERESLLNYAVRMMRNSLVTELLRGEQEKWLGYYTDIPSEEEDSHADYFEEEESIHSDDERYEVDQNISDENSEGYLWFLRHEFDDGLIYDAKGKIRGGTKEALIEHLTTHDSIDPGFNITMLITFRSILTTKEFFYALIYRYNSYPPEGLSFDEYNIWIEKKLYPIKCRVINIMKVFLSQYWTPFYYESGLSEIANFAKTAITQNIPGSDVLLSEIEEKLDDTTTIRRLEIGKYAHAAKIEADQESARLAQQKISRKSVGKTTSASTTYSQLRKSRVLELDAHALACQLTIMEHELYLGITMFECLDRAWGSKYGNMGGSRAISKFIANANSITNFVSFTIVGEQEAKARAKFIGFFISVAQHCKDLNNFSAMTAIISALYSSPIYRLKQTWQLVPKQVKAALSELNNLMDSKKNFLNYREALKQVKDVACVPFFGVFLSDLTFTFAGNLDFLYGSNNSLVNFTKRVKIASIIEDILGYKRFHYKLKRMNNIQSLLDSTLEDLPHIEKQYQMSLQVEPRVGAAKVNESYQRSSNYKAVSAPSSNNEGSGTITSTKLKLNSSRLFK